MSSTDLKVYDEKEIKDKLQKSLDSWNYDGKWIRKVFKTHSWKGTLMAINTIGHLAEVAWHHPDLVVSYAFVEVKLMTHDKKGITDLDFELAKKIDNVVQWNPNSENGPFEGTPKDPRFAYIKL
ncbi:MAG: 4a-hydroxytetrahydrobiopterin dehydratase [Rickettsiales bacterium]|nr:4a-hydroxytetrahydrobiopterin dehydratase [Rickettsiales bacterium]|tara:strand:- start:283 stop:654 length:372 start_codon:yes stop_codon:yes gene_type:complete